MAKFHLKTLGMVVRLDFMNFAQKPTTFALYPADIREKTDLDICFYQDNDGTAIKRIKKGKFRRHVKKVSGGSYCKIFDAKRKKTFCFFEKGVSLNFLVDRSISQSLIAFQGFLDVIFLHSASVVKDNKVYLFIAPSGGGKSTIYSLAKEKGYDALDDESCIIKRKNKRFYASIYPCFRESPAPHDEWEVGGVFFLDKSKINKVREIPVIDAIRKALPEATSVSRDHIPGDEQVDYRGHVFRFLNSVFENVDFKLLEFNKNTYAFSCLN